MVTGRSRGLVRGLVVASHLPPTVMVTAFALALSAGIGAGARTTTLVALAVLTGQLSVGWSNDWLDARRDVAVGRADKPVVTGLVTAATSRAAALVALGACVVSSLATGSSPGAVHVVAVGVAWSYNASLKATWWSWAPYAVSFGSLAVFVVSAAPGAGRPAPWAVAAAASLGVGAHVANTSPDLEDDAATGVRGSPHRLGRRASSVFAPVSLAAASALVVLAPPTPPGPVTWASGAVAVVLALAAGAVGVVRPRSRAPFALSMAVAGVCVVSLVLAAPAVVVPG
ncbi:hypothetical protein OY671_004375 [Metschnikowia pulcherrima]|nr:hypothetical protein OY671_004375 [Metschnikowia pulcherrima]